jgi:hypothetical protein
MPLPTNCRYHSSCIQNKSDGYVIDIACDIAIVELGYDWKMHVESGLAFSSFSYLRGFSFPDFRKRTPGPPAVLVDEFDAGQLEGSSHNIQRRATRLTFVLFELVDRS